MFNLLFEQNSVVYLILNVNKTNNIITRMNENTQFLENLNSDELKEFGFGKFGVEDIQNCFFALQNGTKLALRVWAPTNCLPKQEDESGRTTLIHGEVSNDEKFPAVLEYLPYRKADFTSEQDHQRHPWLASHGYVIIRADIRGTGDSGGLFLGEYLQQEQDDCCSLLCKFQFYKLFKKYIRFSHFEPGLQSSCGVMEILGCLATVGEVLMGYK